MQLRPLIKKQTQTDSLLITYRLFGTEEGPEMKLSVNRTLVVYSVEMGVFWILIRSITSQLGQIWGGEMG